MTSQPRSGIAATIAKILLLALLIASFAIWGIGDMVSGGGRNVTVAKVGDVTISQGALAEQVQREMENLRRSLGENYSPELVKQLNLPRQVLERLISRTLMETEAAKLGLLPTDADVAGDIRTNPAFFNALGKFDKQAFSTILRRNNISEKDYVSQLKQAMAVEVLMGALRSQTAVPEMMITTLYRALEESRAVTLYTLSASAIDVSEPDDAIIEAYYKEQADMFSTPEYRALSYVSFNAADVQKNVTASEEDVRELYDERIDEFRRDERRTVSQLLFENEAEADKAHDMIENGISFEDAAAKAQGKKSIPLGTVEREKILNEAADDVFSLQEGKSTAPIRSAFGWHIFHVSAIVPAGTLSFEEVRANLENDVRQRAAEQALTKLSNQIEDALASGSTLSEAAKDAGLSVKQAGPVNKEGRTPDGKDAKLPALDKFLDVAFATEEKSESPLTSSKGGDYYIVRVDAVTPKRLRPLADVKAQVIAEAKKAQRNRLLAERAKEAAAQLADTNTHAQAVSAFKLKAETKMLKRSDENTLPAALLADLYDRKKNEVTDAYPTAQGDYAIAVLERIVPSTATPPDGVRGNLTKSVLDSMQNERVEQYLRYLRRKHSVSVNETALQATMQE